MAAGCPPCTDLLHSRGVVAFLLHVAVLLPVSIAVRVSLQEGIKGHASIVYISLQGVEKERIKRSRCNAAKDRERLVRSPLAQHIATGRSIL